MIVCLKIADAPSSSAIDRCVSRVPLMDRRQLPGNERQWTCRVWVKEALNSLHNNGIIKLPVSGGKLNIKFIDEQTFTNNGPKI